MPAYLICYDVQKVDNYGAIAEQLREWKSVQPMESLWLCNVHYDAVTIRKLLKPLIGDNEGLFVCEIKPSSDWAGLKVHNAVTAWVRANIGQ
ncbi:hypothetical protein [Sinorhizobium sp. RAC02]|jgi:hypothetical protein|uniref:hypothetical protein n=1 Tax=Sinorhizobium sp. RAC02 TaxID=1842534 RepID=UPI00083E12E3|nr:hypothetical protein [Sinorhizobium sp. RAC02]AOF91322.1 hypothetical protein BSY16_2288 [Sinorhizobium sp. RAC02]